MKLRNCIGPFKNEFTLILNVAHEVVSETNSIELGFPSPRVQIT